MSERPREEGALPARASTPPAAPVHVLLGAMRCFSPVEAKLTGRIPLRSSSLCFVHHPLHPVCTSIDGRRRYDPYDARFACVYIAKSGDWTTELHNYALCHRTYGSAGWNVTTSKLGDAAT